MTLCTHCHERPSVASQDDTHLCAVCLPNVPLRIDPPHVEWGPLPPSHIAITWPNQTHVQSNWMLITEHERILSEIKAKLAKAEEHALKAYKMTDHAQGKWDDLINQKIGLLDRIRELQGRLAEHESNMP